MSLKSGFIGYASVALLAAVSLAAAGRAHAAPTTVVFPAGLVCSFSLQVEITGAPQVSKTFVGADGSVRVLSAGVGSDLVFKNLTTGTTYAVRGNGAVGWTRIDASGSTRITLTGHNVVFYFPSDVPAGPSTTLVVGREDIAVDEGGNFTRLSRSGKTTDICAALS